MDLARLIVEARPTGGVHALADVKTVGEDPVIVHGEGEAAIGLFEVLASDLPHGSVLVLLGVPTEGIDVVDRVELVARQHKFCAWLRGPDFPGLPEGARTWVKHEGGGYGSHLAVLTEAVRRTTGPVLELGAGEVSTPALHDLCVRVGRLVVTVESSEEYAAAYERLASPMHVIERAEDPAETSWLDGDHKWSVVFVDHAPGHTRARAIERARGAEFVAVHDSEELGYGVEPILSTFKYRRDFRRSRPWTTVVSNTWEIWK